MSVTKDDDDMTIQNELFKHYANDGKTRPIWSKKYIDASVELARSGRLTEQQYKNMKADLMLHRSIFTRLPSVLKYIVSTTDRTGFEGVIYKFSNKVKREVGSAKLVEILDLAHKIATNNLQPLEEQQSEVTSYIAKCLQMSSNHVPDIVAPDNKSSFVADRIVAAIAACDVDKKK